jgi:hypothetical protein
MPSFLYPANPYLFSTSDFILIDISNSSLPFDTVFSVYPNLPTNIVLNSSTGQISGQASFSSISQSTTYTVDASYSTGVVSAPLILSIQILPVFNYPDSPYLKQINTQLAIIPFTQIQPPITGLLYSLLSPASLPSGLFLSTNTGLISGTPDTLLNDTTYTLRANNQGITYDASFVLSIQSLPTIAYPQPVYNLTQLVPVLISPVNTNTELQVVYSIAGCLNHQIPPQINLPNGLVFNPTTGVITGTPTVLTTYRTYTITATNSIGSVSFQLILNVIRPVLAPPVVNDNFASGILFTDPVYSMRLKAEILKYKKNSSGLTKKQQWAQTVLGKGAYASRVWANQNTTVTNPNPNNFEQQGNTLLCPSASSIECGLSSGCDVPGPVVQLCYNPAIPLVGYTAPNRKKTNIGFKWPQYS